MAGIIGSFYEREKELAILDIIKNAEKEKKRLSIRIEGKFEPWIENWLEKRGHRLTDSSADLIILIDRTLNTEKITKIRKESRFTALIHPAQETAGIPFVKDKINRNLIPSKEILKDAQVENIFYGFANISYFGFKDTGSERYAFTILAAAMALMVLLSMSTDPPDDLLRHMKAYEYGFDYANLYINSWNFSFDPYIVFDHFTGFLDQNLGQVAGYKAVQALLLIAFFVGYTLNTRHMSDRLRAVIFVLLLLIIGQRIVLGRPADLEGFLLLIGLALSGAPAVIFGTFMGSLYYLFPLYLIPLALLKREYLISMVASLAFWTLYAGESFYLDIFQYLMNIFDNRLMPIGENQTIFLLLMSPAFLIILYMFIRSWNFKFALQAAFFTLVNQIRFGSVLAPLLAISIDEKKLGLDKIRLGPLENLFLIAIMLTLLTQAFPDYHMEMVKLNDSRVFCTSMQCMYHVLYYGENLSITPSMEIGNTHKDIQLAIRNAITNGTMNCSVFDKYQYDYVVEDNLHQIPECLELTDVEGYYRVWKVKE
jgi:hypothetical protein